TDQAQREMAWVEALSDRSFGEKKAALVDLYKRVTDGMRESGYPLGVHFECPYGLNRYAFEVFGAMLDYWTPEAGA
ncbi:MAG: mycobacterial-type methylenetetrahydrofolate reductase, partial [Myxococcota bacterium]